MFSDLVHDNYRGGRFRAAVPYVIVIIIENECVDWTGLTFICTEAIDTATLSRKPPLLHSINQDLVYSHTASHKRTFGRIFTQNPPQYMNNNIP